MRAFLHSLVLAVSVSLALLMPAAAQMLGPSNVKPTDCSGTLTVAGTAQNAFANSGAIHGFQITNTSTVEVMWISFTGTASAGGAGSYPLAPATVTTFAGAGSYYSSVGFNTALSVVAATISHPWSCTFW